MSKETIALLTILRDETLSNDVHARCVAEIKRMEAPTPRLMYPGLNDWFGRGYADAAEADALRVRIK